MVLEIPVDQLRVMTRRLQALAVQTLPDAARGIPFLRRSSRLRTKRTKESRRAINIAAGAEPPTAAFGGMIEMHEPPTVASSGAGNQCGFCR